MKKYQNLLLGLILILSFLRCNRAVDKDQLPEKLVYTYHDKDSVVRSIGIEVDGKREGRWLEFDEEGNLINEEFWKDGKRHGNTSAYLRGKLHYVLPFKHGEMTGKYLGYDVDSGVLIEEGYYKDKKEDSLWIYYDKQGRVLEMMLYRNGKKVKKLM